jgi:hypothetical protein
MTPFSTSVLDELKAYGGRAKAKWIAGRLNVSTRAVTNSLMTMRGEDIVTDGTILYPAVPGEYECAHRPKGEIFWEIGPMQISSTPGCPDRYTEE